MLLEEDPMDPQVRNRLFDEIWESRFLVRNVCRRRLRKEPNRESLVDDITQVTMMHAWRALPKFRQTCSVSTWITRIAINACMDYFRRFKKKDGSFISLDALLEKNDAIKEVSFHSPVSRELENRDLIEQIDLILTPQLRKIFRMRADDLTVDKIARELNVHSGTIKSKVNRIRTRLKQELSNHHFL